MPEGHDNGADESPEEEIQRILRQLFSGQMPEGLPDGLSIDPTQFAQAAGLPTDPAVLQALFASLQQAMQNTDGGIDWSIAKKTALDVAKKDSRKPSAEERAAVDTDFSVAALWLSEVTDIAEAAELPRAISRVEWVFDSIDTLKLLLPAFSGMVATMKFDLDRLERLAPAGFSLATDVAEWLVKQQVPFREAHEITGKLVSYCEENSLGLHEVPDSQMAKISKALTPEVRDVLSVSGSIKSRSGAGGTALPRVLEQISELKKNWVRK
jgi:hypothetical protein